MYRKICPPGAAVGFLLPNFLGFFLFTLFPVVLSFGMAFTNWTLKPAVDREFVGLRNFNDALGIAAQTTGNPLVAFGYVLSALLVVLGLAAAAWLIMSRREPGIVGWGGFILLGAGLTLTAISSGAHHSFYISAALAAFVGWMLSGREQPAPGWPMAMGAFPALAAIIGTLGLWYLHPAMWEAYVPNDLRFWQYLYNTIYLMLGLPLAIGGSLMLALLLNDTLPIRAGQGMIGATLCVVCGGALAALLWSSGYRDAALLAGVLWGIAALGFAFNLVAFRTIFYLPSFTSGVALMILWKALYNPQTGPVNALLATLTGLSASELPQWLASIELAKPSLMIMGFWTAIGGTNMLLYLAALSNVPVELSEAAEIDGASRWQKFANVTWPQLAPTTFFITIVSVIGGLQGGFEQARVMTGGGPAGATTTLSYYIYTLGFQDLNFGYAAAISWVLFAMLFCITAFNWRFGKNLDV